MMRMAAIWLLTAGAAAARPTPSQPDAASRTPPSLSQDDGRKFPRSGGGEEAVRTAPDLSADFDPFAPDNTPPPRAPRFDPRRPSLAAGADPLAALIRNGPTGAVLSPAQSPEPWMLPGTRRTPTLGDPPPGSAPATRAASPRAPEG